MSISGPFEINPHLEEYILSWNWLCFPITRFAAKFSAGNYCFRQDVKVLTGFKDVTAINNNITMSGNRGSGTLKISETE